MPYEVARLTINLGDGGAFEAAVARCAPLFRNASGCRSMRLEREIEAPTNYILRIEWATVEDHVDGFRNSPAFAEWRVAVERFFVAPPEVVHNDVVADHF